MSFSSDRVDEDGSFLIPGEPELGFRCAVCSSVLLAIDIERRLLLCTMCGNTTAIPSTEESEDGGP